MARSIHTFWCERPGPLMILERRKHEGQILTSGGGKRAQTSSTIFDLGTAPSALQQFFNEVLIFRDGIFIRDCMIRP